MPHNQRPRSSLCTLAAETNKKKTRGDRRGRQRGTTRTHSNIQTRSERKQGKETHSTHRERRRREQTRGSPTPPHTHTMQPSTTVPRSTWTRGYSGSSAVLGLPPGPCRPTLSKHSPSRMLRRHRRRGVVESGGKCHGVDRSGQCEACRGQTAGLSTGQPLPAPDGLAGVRRRRLACGTVLAQWKMCKITNDLVQSPSAQWAKGAMEDKLRRQQIRVLSAQHIGRTSVVTPRPAAEVYGGGLWFPGGLCLLDTEVSSGPLLYLSPALVADKVIRFWSKLPCVSWHGIDGRVSRGGSPSSPPK